nr:hypothetical protein R107.3 - Caenorhabditis elegans [Caenorhabditis elegans]
MKMEFNSLMIFQSIHHFCSKTSCMNLCFCSESSIDEGSTSFESTPPSSPPDVGSNNYFQAVFQYFAKPTSSPSSSAK